MGFGEIIKFTKATDGLPKLILVVQFGGTFSMISAF